ncbi:MAG: amidohydrolase family protein, partial [Candidatus Binataceae bacterium]
MKRLAGIIILPDGTGLNGRINFSDRIDSIEACSDSLNDYILPGLIDLQINGHDDINVAEAPAADLRRMAARLAREGTAAFLPTVITAPIAQIESADAAILEARDSQARAGAGEAAIIGMHLEGPFISPMRRGAHPECALAPAGEALERVLRLKSLRLITLAPELDGASEAIARFVNKGVAVSLGHSNASFEEAVTGVAAGARMFTHLFNAMRPIANRDPGIAAAGLLS